MSIEVLSSGLLSTVQDRGRLGYTGYGVPVSGVMDQYSAGVANLLLHNPVGAAVLEITLQGPKLCFRKATRITVGGLGARITLDEKEVRINEPQGVRKGQTLQIHRITRGARVYLAVKDGFRTEEVLNSRSFYAAVTGQSKIKAGDQLPFRVYEDEVFHSHATVKFDKERYRSHTLEVFPGPEWKLLPGKIQKELQGSVFHISKHNNRMAYQLREKIENAIAGIYTQPVLPGTVQFTPAGNLIILMRDCQITGGYPRIFQLTEDSLNRLAQKKMGEEIQFRLTEY